MLVEDLDLVELDLADGAAVDVRGRRLGFGHGSGIGLRRRFFTQVVRRDVLLTLFFGVELVLGPLMLDQVEREQAVQRVGLRGILGLVGHRQESAERSVATAEGPEPLLDADHQVDQRLEPIAADGGVGIRLLASDAGRLQHGAGQAGLHQDRLHLLLGMEVPPLLLAALDHVERAAGPHTDAPRPRAWASAGRRTSSAGCGCASRRRRRRSSSRSCRTVAGPGLPPRRCRCPRP